ncbi:hypothetical protein [Streptomyces sp. CdTB01]|uniref:hypothetical protein n=1 Tax=Streptomyces sp. CdTB01 TaxID=1725411 RepID=UPI00131EDA34|nr:hypothetical protein [Streptomyces sp. CdTB01]
MARPPARTVTVAPWRCIATVHPFAVDVSANAAAAMGSHTPGAASVSATTGAPA